MTNAILSWKPTEKQMAFLNDTGSMKVASCSNWAGKSTMLAFETACHLLGVYPDWWTGKKFNNGISAIVVGTTADRVRDTLQKKIIELVSDGGRVWSCSHKPGVPNAIDSINVQHKNGEFSELRFLNNEMWPTRFQLHSVDFAAIDEQIDPNKLFEVRVHAASRDGVVSTAFTPFDVHYYSQFSDVTIHTIGMSDCPWVDKDLVLRAAYGWKPEEVSARLNGLVVEAKDE